MNGRLPRFAIVNPLSLVGKELRAILHQRGTLFSHVDLLDTTGEAEGTLTDVADEAAVVNSVRPDSFEDVDLVFYCGAGTDDESWVETLTTARVIDLTGRLTGARQIVAGVNSQSIGESGSLASPHPATVVLAHLFHALATQGAISAASATILQPASMYDQKGVDELFAQTIASLNLQSQPREVFDRQLAFNHYTASGAAELESTIAEQLASVLGSTLPGALSLIQSTSFHGLSVNLFVRFEAGVEPDALRTVLAGNPAIEIREGEDSASTVDAAGIDEILIGRIQEHSAIPNALSVWAVVDNLRRGTALNAVLIAEELTSRVAN